MSIHHLARALITATILIVGVAAGAPAYAAPASQPSSAACKDSAASTVPSAMAPATRHDTYGPAPDTAGNNGYGKLYYREHCQDKNCAAVSVYSPGRSLGIIETARHCVENADKGSIFYYPGYQKGDAPNGKFQIVSTFYFASKGARAGHQYDVAFALVARGSNGQSLNSVGYYNVRSISNLTSISGIATLGHYKPDTSQFWCNNYSINNYPRAADTWQMDHCEIKAGASGSPLFQQVGTNHEWQVVGVLIGFTGTGGVDAFGHYNEDIAQGLYDDARNKAA
jgi:hypothetical protein